MKSFFSDKDTVDEELEMNKLQNQKTSKFEE